MEEKRILVAMSGGVDSSVAAYLATQSGATGAGATLRLIRPELLPEGSRGNLKDVEDARAVATKLHMDFYVFDAQELFCKEVVDRFVRTYEEGGTPNPCIECNRYIKFSHLLTKARQLGCTHIATGHYAQIRQDAATGRYLLYKAKDESKDQSYFLASLNQDQLAHTLFPLGSLSKEQVRAIALEQGFVNAHKKDSQDVCFIPDGDYKAFMCRYTGKEYPEGAFLDLQGNPVGRHAGAVGYTLGQRKGLGLAMGAPVYVCKKDMAANTVTVGPEEALYSSVLIADGWNFIPFDTLIEPIRVTAKARSRHIPQPATVYPEEGGRARVVFDTPQRAMTPGQAVVLYQEDLVVGSGTIQKVL